MSGYVAVDAVCSMPMDQHERNLVDQVLQCLPWVYQVDRCWQIEDGSEQQSLRQEHSDVRDNPVLGYAYI